MTLYEVNITHIRINRNVTGWTKEYVCNGCLDVSKSPVLASNANANAKSKKRLYHEYIRLLLGKQKFCCSKCGRWISMFGRIYQENMTVVCSSCHTTVPKSSTGNM